MDRVGAGVPDWLNVSRETFERLAELVALVEKWTPTINLISKTSRAQIWRRHVYDSAQIFGLAAKADHWLDLGSGAGFPGLIVAILAHEAAPDLQVTLVEADQRKSIFLAQAVRELGLSARVIAQRIETLPQQNADVLSARAVAPLAELCGYAHRHLGTGGLALFPKGAQAEDEIATARKSWRFDVMRHPSKTDEAATILAIRDIIHV